MEGIKEKQQLSGEFHHPVENKIEEQKLGLGFQNLDSADPTLDHQSLGDRDDELRQKLHKMTDEGSSNDEEKVSGLVSASAMVEKQKETEKALDKELLVGEEISGKKDQDGDRDLEGFTNGGFVMIEDTKDRDGEDEAKIEKSIPEKCTVVEENEAEFKEIKEMGTDKEGSKWSEIEDEEENDYIEGKNEGVAGEKEAIDKYENGWGENWDDGSGRIEAKEEQQYFDNYEDERNGKEQYDEEPHWYGNVEGNSVGLNDGNSGSSHHPLRPDAEDCSFYMRTGTCKFGSTCKFSHPLGRKNQAAKDSFKQNEENSDRPGQTECKYYLTSGGCKYGNACRYNHSRGKPVAPILEFNFLGLPIRVGETECPYYMRTGSCKYGSNCRFNHPDPTVVGRGDTASHGSIKDSVSGWSSARTLNKTAPFVPVTYPPSPMAPPNAEWNGYQAPVYPTSQRNLPIPPAFAMNIPATDANFYAHPVEEFPERPGQPECSYYLKTGDCKYRSGCKFHHPKNWKTSFTLSDQGLPLRPEQSICSHYSRYGICKFGPSCKYDHSVTNGTSASSPGSYQGQPTRYGNFGDLDGKWKMEPMQQFA